MKAEAWKSPKKEKPAARLIFATRDGQYQFADALFLSPKAMWRLALVAQRICGMSKDASLPDDDNETCHALARFIVNNAPMKDALITIEERDETYFVTEGMDAGQKKTVKRRRVAAAGYEAPPTTEEANDADDGKDTIPF